MPFFLCVSCVCAVFFFYRHRHYLLLLDICSALCGVACNFTPYSYCGVAVLYGEGLLVAKKGYRFVLLFFL